MKHFLRLAWGADASPIQLLFSVLLGFGVMIYINVVLGALGGIPAFIAFSVVFFLIRAVQLSGRRISHFAAVDSFHELLYLWKSYAGGYLLFYVIMRAAQMFASITGWGNMKGKGVAEYFLELYGTNIMERSAYVITFLFMLSFVISLFPLIIIRRVHIWAVYLVGIVTAHLMAYGILIFHCVKHIPRGYRKKVSSLVDALLLCKIDHAGEIAGYAVMTAIYVVISIALSFWIAYMIYRPRPGAPIQNADLFAPLGEKEILILKEKSRRKRLRAGIISVLVFALLSSVFVYIFFVQKDRNKRYSKVGECLTKDVNRGPMRYGAEVYVPIAVGLDYDETGIPLGYLAMKGENCDSRYYRLAIENILYKSGNSYEPYLEVVGTEIHSYLPVQHMETRATWEDDSLFLLWDEDWQSESLYAKEATGYSVCPRELVELLEKRFGTVTYSAEDFADYDAYFTVSGHSNLQKALLEDAGPGEWIGCILVKDNQFYYGNYENKITGVALGLLKNVLGGANR